MLRWNPHFHAIVLEGGFDENDEFKFLPLYGKITEVQKLFTLAVLNKLLKLKVISFHQKKTITNWRHSGFSVDNRVRIYDDKALQFFKPAGN